MLYPDKLTQVQVKNTQFYLLRLRPHFYFLSSTSSVIPQLYFLGYTSLVLLIQLYFLISIS